MSTLGKLALTIISLHVFVAIIVNLSQQDKITKNWARLFSIGQCIMAIQFAVGWLLDSQTDDIPYILSALNNLFFLGGALILLERENMGSIWRYLFSLRLFQVVTFVTFLAIGIKVTALVVSMDSQQSAFLEKTANLPITLVSILVYLVESFAYFSILGFFRHQRIRYLPILIAILYSLVEISAYADPTQYVLMAPVVTILRFLYFIPPIMILLIRMPQDPVGKEVFENTIPERKFILSRDTGMVKALGRSIAANKVLLLIKKLKFNLDESDSITDRFTYYGWQEKWQTREPIHENRDELLMDITDEERKCLYEVCQADQHVFCRSKNRCETIMLPLIMYGGMIGVLFVRLNKGVRARSIFAEKLKLSIRTVLPLVQSSRQLKAIRILSNNFTENLIGAAGIDKTENPETKLSVTDGVDKILDSMLETLSPLAIALRPSQHFNSEKPVLWKVPNREFPVSKQGIFEKRFPVSMQDAFEKKYFTPEPDESPLEEIMPFQQDLEFGRMIIFVQDEKDSLQRPTIGVHENVFNALGAIINNALKVILRRNLNRILAAADKKMREGGMDGHETVQVLQEAAKAFGISWIVIAVDDQSRYFGDEEKVALARRYPVDDEKITKRRITAEDGRSFCLIRSSTGDNSSQKNNGHSRHQINFWFGIENTDFDLDDTWKDIFLQFIQLGANKIKDMVMKEMVSKIEAKIAEIEEGRAVMTLVHLQGNLTHKFGTFIKGHEVAIERLEDDIKTFKLEIPEKIEQDIERLKASYFKLLNLTRTMFWGARLTELNKKDWGEENVRPCDLRRAIDDALEEVKWHLELLKVEPNLDCSDNQGELMVDAPYLVVYLSIFNLLSNSIKALSRLTSQSREKKIAITTRVNGKHVFCRIKDTGEGIKDINKLYDLESGWGLYLTMVSLRDNNCTIEVIENGGPGTTFEMRFPTCRQK